MRVVVVGGTGFVGQRLVRLLASANHGVVVASRDPARAQGQVPGAAATCGLSGDSLRQALAGAGAVVNLAGENIFEGRWSDERKGRLRDSRVGVTQALVAEIGAIDPARRPQVLVNASAIGFYGDTGEDERDEASPAGTDFLARLCVDWELAARGAERHGVRVVPLRFGIVLGRGGGALAELVKVFRAFVGAPLGPGHNWMSWIHQDDLCLLVAYVLEDPKLRGPMNAVAPEPVRQVALCRALARRLHRPCWPGVPRPIVRLLFGEKADMLLESVRVAPKAALEARFAFRFAKLEDALDDLV